MVIEVAALLSLHQWNFQIAFIIILGIVKFHFAVFLDLSKAFDTLDHNILLNKIRSFMVSEEWQNNYLRVISLTDNNLFKLMI